MLFFPADYSHPFPEGFIDEERVFEYGKTLRLSCHVVDDTISLSEHVQVTWFFAGKVIIPGNDQRISVLRKR